MDGFDAAGWLHLEKLEAIAGGTILGATQTRHVLFLAKVQW